MVSAWVLSGEMHGIERQIDKLDSNKRHNDATDAIDNEVSAQQRLRRARLIFHALQSKWNESNDDQCIENNRREDCRVRRGQMHDIEGVTHRTTPRKLCRNSSKNL